MTTYEMQAREKKAHKLADLLSFLDRDQFSRMTEQSWKIAAEEAKVTIPSMTTRVMVGKLLEARWK